MAGEGPPFRDFPRRTAPMVPLPPPVSGVPPGSIEAEIQLRRDRYTPFPGQRVVLGRGPDRRSAETCPGGRGHRQGSATHRAK
jgi:hypothetical protein